MISMTHYDELSLLFKLLNLLLYLKACNPHLCYFLLNIAILIFISTYFFDNITLCINLPNVTLSNKPHLVYITHFGETDGVTLSRLDCNRTFMMANKTSIFHVCIVCGLFLWNFLLLVRVERRECDKQISFPCTCSKLVGSFGYITSD